MPAIPKGREFTDKQAAFIREYLIDKSITQAALRAGYSPRTAAKIGSELIAKPHIKAGIAKALKAQERRTLISADQVLLDINTLAEKAARAGAYHAAIRGKELVGKHYKLFTERHEHGGIGGGPVVFQLTPSEENH